MRSGIGSPAMKKEKHHPRGKLLMAELMIQHLPQGRGKVDKAAFFPSPVQKGGGPQRSGPANYFSSRGPTERREGSNLSSRAQEEGRGKRTGRRVSSNRRRRKKKWHLFHGLSRVFPSPEGESSVVLFGSSVQGKRGREGEEVPNSDFGPLNNANQLEPGGKENQRLPYRRALCLLFVPLLSDRG